MLGISGLAALGGIVANPPADAQQINGKEGLSFFNVRDFNAVNDGSQLVAARKIKKLHSTRCFCSLRSRNNQGRQAEIIHSQLTTIAKYHEQENII